ncbi:DUF2490 domain-containing protein [Gammaproteobacteria bacterium]|nr:DUF2490 domain-containing protein [Gammaproteobacteria bacterium]
MRIISILALCLFLSFSSPLLAQVDQGQTGAWYMYLWSHENNESGFGLQGDIQHRNWDTGGDLEQLLIRAGLTWRPDDSAFKYTLGYAHITSGAFGSSNEKNEENRIYQEALGGQRLGNKWFLTHRFRLEQRWVNGQDFRARLRYFVGLNYPFNQENLNKGALYLSLYNELFVNLNRDIGDGRHVDYFDRNRAYAALGYSLDDNFRLQFGYMWQGNNNYGKGQLQFNLIHSF